MKSQSLLSLSAWLFSQRWRFPLTIAAQDAQQPTLTQYTVTDLGTLPGGNFSQPFFMNRYALISGSSLSLADGSQHAALWLDGLMGDIGAPGLGRIPNSIAFGDNGDFQSAGEAETSTPDPNGEDFCGFGTHLTCSIFLFGRTGKWFSFRRSVATTARRMRLAIGGKSPDLPRTRPRTRDCPSPQVLRCQSAPSGKEE